MRRIATTVAAVVVVLLIAAAAAPFWLGMKAEEAYTDIVRQLASNNSATISTKRYERGWLGAHAETLIEVPGVPLNITLNHEIAHGPVPIMRIIEGNLDFTPALAFIDTRSTVVPKKGLAADSAKALRQFPPMKATTMIGFAGEADTDIDIPAVRKGKAGRGLNWRGLTGSMMFRDGGQHVTIELSSPGVTVPLKQGRKLALGKLRFHSDSQGRTGGLMFGNSSLHVANLTIGEDVSVKSLRFTTRATPAGKNLNTKVSYRVKDVTVGDRQYGPGELTIVLRKLDLNALRKYEQRVNAISKRKRLPQEQASMMVAAETMKLVANLSKRAPELEITKLSFKSPEGDLTGNAKFVLDGSNLNVSENAMLLVRAIQGEAALKIPLSMVKAILTPQIRQDIETYKDQGRITSKEAAMLTPKVMSRIVDEAYRSYLSRNAFTRLLVPAGSYYRISASFKQGKFLVNNKPLALPM